MKSLIRLGDFSKYIDRLRRANPHKTTSSNSDSESSGSDFDFDKECFKRGFTASTSYIPEPKKTNNRCPSPKKNKNEQKAPESKHKSTGRHSPKAASLVSIVAQWIKNWETYKKERTAGAVPPFPLRATAANSEFVNSVAICRKQSEKDAYRWLCLQFHPDKYAFHGTTIIKDKATKVFQAMTSGYNAS